MTTYRRDPHFFFTLTLLINNICFLTPIVTAALIIGVVLYFPTGSAGLVCNAHQKYQKTESESKLMRQSSFHFYLYMYKNFRSIYMASCHVAWTHQYVLK